MTLPITLYPKKSLNKPSELVTVFDTHLTELARQMNEAMIRENGIGLAAPQVGRNIQLIIVKIGEEGSEYRAYANPRITFSSGKSIAIEEGCLSVPGVFGYVKRAAKVRVSYQDLSGAKKTEKATGMEAIVLQHEIDHIKGTLIINHELHVTKGDAILSRLRP